MGTEGMMGSIARQEWLKPVEESLQKLVHRAFSAGGTRGQKVKNFLHGTRIGHPLHVILTDIPIGAWTAGLVFDGLDMVSENRGFRVAADGALGIGVAGAVAAALAGLADWSDVDPPARRIGLSHAALNVGGLTLFAASLMARRRKARGRARAFAMLGYAIVTTAARLGGNLVYEQRIGIDRTAGQTLPTNFVAVMDDSELREGTPGRAVHEGVPILLVRRGQRIFALAEMCSHLGGPLSEGKLTGDSIQCPWHGSRFALQDGRVLDGPAVHPQPCLEARVRNGKIEVRKYVPIAAGVKLPERSGGDQAA
jgi:nitrite reductase/ring-hydroxylating ferredoxin subunit/uncharacterized membrane protein